MIRLKNNIYYSVLTDTFYLDFSGKKIALKDNFVLRKLLAKRKKKWK